MKSLLNFALAFVTLFTIAHAKRPEKIYGVNLGNWLVFEPWMAEREWKSMGGQSCSDCSICIRSEWQVAFSAVYAWTLLIGFQGSQQGFPQHRGHPLQETLGNLVHTV
jgi:hypothetical protein